MSIRIFPTWEDLSKYPERLKWAARSVLFLAVLAAVVFYVAVVFSILPSIVTDQIRFRAVLDQHTSCLRAYNSIRRELTRDFYPHARYLYNLNAKSDSAELTLNDLKLGLEQPNVLDVFLVDFDSSRMLAVRNLLPTQILIDSVRLKAGERTINDEIISPSKRYKVVDTGELKYILVIRDIKPYPPLKTHLSAGVVLDWNNYYNSIPARLDSLYIVNYGLDWLDMMHSSDDLKSAHGIMYGQDTVWWTGNSDVQIKNWDWNSDSWEHSGIIETVSGLGLMVYIRSIYPPAVETTEKSVSAIVKIVQFAAVVGLAALLLLLYTVSLARRQVVRNQIALAHLAHAIKTPVARLRLNTDSLLKDMVASPEEEKGIIQSISQECERLEGAVHGAALSLEGIKHRLKLEHADLKDIIVDAGERWETSFDHSGVKLNIEGDSAKGMYDRELLSVMLDNLLDNALRHTILNKVKVVGKTPEVTLGLRRADKNVRVTVDDMGGGIPPKERKQLFRRFQRVSGSAGTGVTGLGLGLALVKEIAEAHGGKVKVEDNDRGGARFVVEL